MALRTTADLRAAGFGFDELTRLVAKEELVRVRRGAYAEQESEPLTPEARHRRLVEATVPLVASDAVVSHRSAAVLHGLRCSTRPPTASSSPAGASAAAKSGSSSISTPPRCRPAR